MTLAKAWELQADVYSRLVAALDVPVHTDVPSNPPARYCRIDGFTVAGEETYRNQERGRHGFTVHLFDAPAGGTSSLKWVRQQSTVAHAALNRTRLDGASRGLRMEAASATFDPTEQGDQDAHAFVRYTTTIGD